MLEHIGQCYEYQRRTTIRLYTYRQRGRKHYQARKDCYERIDAGYLKCGINQVCFTLKITGISAQATHGNAQRIESLAKSFFGIPTTHLVKAEMLDIVGNKAEEILNREINRILKNGIL